MKRFNGRHVALGMIVFGLFTLASAIEISPSKYQGGTTNAQPYQAQGAPSLLRAPFKWIFGEGRSEAMKRIQAPPNFKVDLQIEPQNFAAVSNATLKAKMVLHNQGKEKFILEFPTAQHFEFVIQEISSGKEMYRWSRDKEFSQQLSTILVNQKDKISYEEEIFSASNQVTSLPPGDYKMRGEITSKTPISVESSFHVSPE